MSPWARAKELAARTPETRNRYVDFLRAASVTVVVIGHWLIAAAYVDDGQLKLGDMLRARFRHLDDPTHQVFGSNFEREELLTGKLEEVVRYHFSIPAIANTFKKGHRIRIAVMNALDNYYFPNSNTGGDEGTAAETVTGTMRIHHSAEYPSHVKLSILSQ